MNNEYLNKYIIVTRKDSSVRDVMIMKAERTDKYCFINLTTYHVCKCRFDTIDDAVNDLKNNEFVLKFELKNE